jgi:hypothetical protein
MRDPALSATEPWPWGFDAIGFIAAEAAPPEAHHGLPAVLIAPTASHG